MRTLLYPATSDTDHYAAPGDFHANCGQGSPTKLCDNGVFVNEQVALPSEVFLISFFRPSLLPPSSVPPRHSHAPRDGASNGLKPVLGGFICSVCQGTDFLGVAFPRFATPRHLQMQGPTHTRTHTPTHKTLNCWQNLGSKFGRARDLGCVCVLYYCRTYYKAVRVGGGGDWRTCATRDDEPRPVWTSLPITH